jgi:hypothetical protein
MDIKKISMEKNIYAICGYSKWGKSNTLYEIFDKKGFQPLKSPIQTKRIPGQDFIVINASNEDRPTEKYLKILKDIIKKHTNPNTKIVITISLLFNKPPYDPKIIIDYLNNLTDYNIYYIVLKNSWFKDESISKEDLDYLESYVDCKNGKIIICPDIISQNSDNFSNRVTKIIKIISK